LQNVTIVVLFSSIALVLLGSLNSASAVTETVFEEDFDNGLTGWSQSVCIRSDLMNQICEIDQAVELFDFPNDPPNSFPFWGFVQIDDREHPSGPEAVEVRYKKSFNVSVEDDYNVSAWLGIKDCSGCNIRTQLYIDGTLVFEKVGHNIPSEPVGPHKFFEQTIIHLAPGSHDVEMGMQSNFASKGMFRASFDDIKISRDVPTPTSHSHELEFGDTILGPTAVVSSSSLVMTECPPGHVMTGFTAQSFSMRPKCNLLTIQDFIGVLFAVGGKFLQIDTISILLAYAIVNAVWMAPIGIGIGIGIYLVKRKIE